ncbi:MAG: hypothetical protein ACXVB9_16350 [Bdellovibrionota bacterium]
MKLLALLSALGLSACASAGNYSSRTPSSALDLSPQEKEAVCRAMEEKYSVNMHKGSPGQPLWEYCVKQGTFSKYKGRYTIKPPAAGGDFDCQVSVDDSGEGPQVTELDCAFHGW